MAKIVMTDDGALCFDGQVADRGALGGAESAFVGLAEAFAARGHAVTVYNNRDDSLDYKGVSWLPLAFGPPEDADLHIANRGGQLLDLVPRARRKVFWIHNPARYLRKWRHLRRLWRHHPPIVFSGAYHASTLPPWIPHGGKVVIPHGITEIFRTAPPAKAPPPPHALFTSNPLRGLSWLLDLWCERIRPAVPEAELHVFSGPQTYGAYGARKGDAMRPVLERAASLVGAGVRLRDPVAKSDLANAMRQMRLYLYRGDPEETFCASAGEAQAMGLPGVVGNIGSLGERIDDGVTGFVGRDDEAFAAAAIRLLTEDALWHAQHEAALDRKRQWGWNEAAARFEAFLA